MHLCTDEGLCAFDLSVNEMLYQSVSEKLLSVQVFMCRCSYEKTVPVVCMWERDSVSFPAGQV